MVYVHAHVRGGGEGGRRWWLDGRLEHKQHTFDDHIAVADGLARPGSSTAPGSPPAGSARAGCSRARCSASGPDRWRAVVAEVPFVDVVTTMLDASIPLTVTEWDEWGDPRRREEFDWMLAYSPYDNLPPAGGRPDLLVTGALHDPRVMVWEPAKWVAALRETDPEWSPRCLFRVRDRRRRPRRPRRAGSPTWPTRPRSTPGSGSDSLGRSALLTREISNE